MTIAASVVQGILLTFALVVIIMPPFIALLRRLGFGKRIREEGPGTHMVKEGTPTMGGVLIIVVVAASAALFHVVAEGDFFDPNTIAPILTLLLVGFLGAADDYLNSTTGEGIRIRQKLLWQIVVAGAIAYQIQQTYDIRELSVPFIGDVPIEPWAYIFFAALAIVATTNGVNFTDGLDGLAGGTLIFAFVAYMIIALLAGQTNLAVLCALLIGALLGFLWFNVHPAQIFMGDSGSLALGACLAVMALITGQILLLPLIGIIFVLEAGSDVLQIASFKLTGKRIFKMAPLHHHFELLGWDEEKITMRFWIVGVLAAMLGVTFFFLDHGSAGVSGSVTMAGPIDLASLELNSFAGRRVAVLGLARSGVALCRFLSDHGAIVTAYDGRSTVELTEQLAKLEERPIRMLLGPDVDPRAALTEQDMVCTSPSISSRYPTTEPRLRAALAEVEAEGRVPVVSEVDLFLRLCPATTIGITGTKGKTTTSSLIAAVLAAGGSPVVLGGNIGIPLVERLPELTPAHRVVLELSELQLPTISRGTDVAVYTHVTSDHIDRHGTVEAYRAVKRRLAELVRPDGFLVLNAEDPISAEFATATSASVVSYRRSEPAAGGVGVRDGWIVADGVPQPGGGTAMTGPGGRVLSLLDVTLPGAHNTSNVLAAVAVGLVFGIAPDAIRQAVMDFTGVEHRLEQVATIDGVRFVNDSQGTQPDAVIAALRSFDPPIVLICGGRSKDLDLRELADEVALRAAAVVLIGETAANMERIFGAAGARQMVRADDMAHAVQLADAIAREILDESRAATVLLSPAATSFDMFVDYAARGAAFKAAVQELAEAVR